MDRVTAQSRAGVETSSLSIFGLKVFMDAHMPVTHKEGDRYPLGPPSFESVSKRKSRCKVGWPAECAVNNGGRKTLAKNRHVGQVSQVTYRDLAGLV